MGQALSSFFTQAEEHAGVHGKRMLADLTEMTTTQAAEVADSPALVARFESAMGTLRSSVEAARFEPLPAQATASTLRSQMAAVLDLMTQRALVFGDVVQGCQRINEAAAHTLHVERVGVWQLGNGRTLRCLDLYDRRTQLHTAGQTLDGPSCRPYLRALLTETTLAAHEAQTDVRTKSLAERYLMPHGITSMLDVPVWVYGKLAAVVCHEHVGPPRQWFADEERFAYMMGSLVSLAFECAKP
jgi:GAF domain-containing protein